ncbi:MAG: hypothetical protein ABGW84_02450 [Sphingomonadaceae bacterium]
MFDGDVNPESIGENCARLPGGKAVEILFKESAMGNIARLSEISGKEGLPIILNGIEGADHHDWFEEFAKELGVSKAEAFGMLFRLWIELEQNEELATEFVRSIQDIVDAAPH